MKEIYLGGGCFWGMEKLMRALPGVMDVVCGYANGVGEQEANYRSVCDGDTGFRETVRVCYDPAQTELEDILLVFYYVINPTVEKQQGPDVGDQYQTGVWYTDPADEETVRRVAAIEAAAVDRFAVEIGPLQNFFPAEEYHQRYLEKNPMGYCHIRPPQMREALSLRLGPEGYTLPAKQLAEQKA